MRSGKSYLAAHRSWDNPDADTSCPLCSEAPQTFEYAVLFCPSSTHQRSRLLQGVSDLAPRPHRPSNMPSCPAPSLPIRDPASSQGSRTWPPRPQSGPTNSCSLCWLSSFAPPLLVCLQECPPLLPLSTLPLQTHSFNLPPDPPLALETSQRFILSLILAMAALRPVLVALEELVIFVSFVDGYV